MLISTRGQSGLVQARLTGEVLAKLRLLVGRRWKDRDCLFPLSANNLRYLRQTFPDAEWSPELQARVADLDQRDAAAKNTARQKHGLASLPDDDYPWPMPPFHHQREAFLLSRDAPDFGYFMEVGTGKTYLMVSVACYLYLQQKLDLLLVFAPNGVHEQWVEELPALVPSVVPYRAAAYSSSMSKRRTAEFQDVLNAQNCLKVIAVNIEAMSLDKGCERIVRLMDGWRTLAAIDESDLIKTPSTKRTRNMWKVGRAADYRRIATGSEADEGYENLYAQFRYLNPDILGCQTYAEFRARYVEEIGQYRQIVGYRNVPDLTRRMDPYIYRAEKAKCLDLPPTTTVRRPVPLTEEQARLHRELVAQMFTEVRGFQGDWVAEAPLMIQRLGLLRRIAAGFLKRPDGGYDRLPTNRTEVALELVRETRHKVIVWGSYQEEITILMEAFDKAGISAVRYDGLVSERQRQLNKARFQDDDTCKVFVSTPQVGGAGLNLQIASTVVYHSPDWSRRNRVQTEGRVARPGQVNAVTYIDLFAPRSVEVKVLRQQESKAELAQVLRDPATLLDWLQELQDMD